MSLAWLDSIVSWKDIDPARCNNEIFPPNEHVGWNDASISMESEPVKL